MSENSSDSDSSCGWTVINHEGSDVEALASENEGPGEPVVLGSEESVTLVPEEQPEEPLGLRGESGQNDASSVVDQIGPPSETLQPAAEGAREQLPEEGSCVGVVSDDSDIVTLETPKIEEIGSPEEASQGEEEEEEEAPVSEEFNMGTSSSSQYAFCRPEAVLPPPLSGEESSSDETSRGSSPTLRRRRAKKRRVSSSESEEAPRGEQEPGPEPEPEPPGKQQFSSGLNRCIILALVVAVSMGFGHFYGTMQIQNRQLVVEKTHEEELSGVKDHLLRCRQGQEPGGECQSLKEGLATCLLSTEVEKKSFASRQWSLASENQHLRESLKREEQALAVLQGELRKLREQIRHLEERKEAEGQKPKAHLEEERHRRQSFVQQKAALFSEAQMLRRELDRERQLTAALREELDRLSSRQAEPVVAESPPGESREVAALRGRLEELEKKLSFEEQRSDLWEKLYVEVKGHAEKPVGKAKRKAKASFLGSVKETFDAMKNSTKEFVRHHKEKIKQAKEAVKENLRKFSDSVKSTFRHFKDSTKDIFEEQKRRPGGEGPPKGGKAGPHRPMPPCRAPGGQRESREGGGAKEGRPPSQGPRDPASPKRGRKHQAVLKGCVGTSDCAHQEFLSLFDRSLGPIRVDEFSQLVHRYLQQEVAGFHHWRELDGFLSQFFRNGIFIHDQMLFTDFVSDVKDYLEDLKEYRRAFEDMDRYIYTYYFRHDHAPQQGPRQPPRRTSFSQHQERPSPKYQQRHKKEREGKWSKQGRANGRHVANVEIEWGQLPLDPKY